MPGSGSHSDIGPEKEGRQLAALKQHKGEINEHRLELQPGQKQVTWPRERRQP